MASFQLPYHALVKKGALLVAARGASLELFNSEGGLALSLWRSAASTDKASTESSTREIGEDSPPTKKRKLSSPEIIIAEAKSNNPRMRQNSGLEAPAVTVLAVTRTTPHVIAVTGEDKCIRVLEIVSDKGPQHLRQISQRAMPKRPCALAVTKDDTTIICADKFGDVYSLPLIVSEPMGDMTRVKAQPVTSNHLVPAANELTIHSQRNRKALENQKRQTNAPPEKLAPTFESTLQLGHVSMLTDLQLATLDGRDYIISADRDEHIRVSRGLPQTHIIHGFCLGHCEFVSRLCIPSHRPEVLISGGGEDCLFVWDWKSGKVLSKTNLLRHVNKLQSKTFTDVTDETLDIEVAERESIDSAKKLAVSGIYYANQSAANSIILVACEGVPAIFVFDLMSDNKLKHIGTTKMPGNILAVVTDFPSGQENHKLGGRLPNIVIAVDNVHRPGSTTDLRGVNDRKTSSLQKFTLCDGELIDCGEFSSIVDKGQTSSILNLTNLLYNFENLRKRGEGEVGEE